MKLRTLLAAVTVVLAGCAGMQSGSGGGGWTTLVDGKSMGGWNKLGDANWRVAEGTVMADKGSGFLVTPGTYRDFQIRAEFWADEDANSGIFIRCSDPAKIGAATCYEVNIYDKRPDPVYGTGAIVDLAKVVPMPKAGGKWNTYDITAKGDRLIVVFNGVQTVDVRDAKLASGVIALQYAPGVVKDKGVIKWRKVEIRPL